MYGRDRTFRGEEVKRSLYRSLDLCVIVWPNSVAILVGPNLVRWEYVYSTRSAMYPESGVYSTL